MVAKGCQLPKNAVCLAAHIAQECLAAMHLLPVDVSAPASCVVAVRMGYKKLALPWMLALPLSFHVST